MEEWKVGGDGCCETLSSMDPWISAWMEGCLGRGKAGRPLLLGSAEKEDGERGEEKLEVAQVSLHLFLRLGQRCFFLGFPLVRRDGLRTGEVEVRLSLNVLVWS